MANVLWCKKKNSAETARERNEWIASICQCLTALNITIQDPREMRIEVVRKTATLLFNQVHFINSLHILNLLGAVKFFQCSEGGMAAQDRQGE
jgi:hypothetical protein